MSFTSSNIAGMAAAMKRAAGDLLSLAPVDLYGGGTVSVKMAVGMRRAASPELTGGTITEAQYATIDADDWDAKVGRPPQKGDVVHWAGRRFAIETNQVVAPDGQITFYKCRLQG